MKSIKDYKILIILVSVLVAISLIFVTTKRIIKSKKTNDNQSISTTTEIVEETNKEEDNLVVAIENEDLELENVNPEDTSWDEEAEETKVDEKEEKKAKQSGTSQYYIKINYTANVVTIYSKDGDGNYTVPVKALVCSTGTATPKSGIYKMSNKYRWHMLNGGVYGQYCTRITGHILFHSVPYATNSPDSLKYVAYDKLGTKASAGCIRLTVQDAMWVYNNCASGTYVEFYSSSDPGPLGKPTARKISSNVDCRNWDPTDPDPRNPWNGYVEPKNTEIVEEVKKPEEKEQIQEEIKTNETKQNDIQNQEIVKKDNNTNSNVNTNTSTSTNTNTNVNTNTNTSSNQTKGNKTSEEKNESINNTSIVKEQGKKQDSKNDEEATQNKITNQNNNETD